MCMNGQIKSVLLIIIVPSTMLVIGFICCFCDGCFEHGCSRYCKKGCCDWSSNKSKDKKERRNVVTDSSINSESDRTDIDATKKGLQYEKQDFN